MNTTWLEDLQALAETLNFSQAAEKRNITQLVRDGACRPFGIPVAADTCGRNHAGGGDRHYPPSGARAP